VASEWEALRAFRGVSEGDMVRYALAKREPLLVEHELFRDAVTGAAHDSVDTSTAKIVTLAQGLRTVEVAAAILESVHSGVQLSAPRKDVVRDGA
jgi:UDP-N-acetylglucosamine 3-dehydrogenase